MDPHRPHPADQGLLVHGVSPSWLLRLDIGYKNVYIDSAVRRSAVRRSAVRRIYRAPP
jgi:hypothetical protein